MSATPQPRVAPPASPSLDPVGLTIGGYRIEREIGRGATGIVYLATHPALRTRAAVKVLHQAVSSRRQLTERLISELRILATLRNPHLAQVHDLVTIADDRLAVVSEHVEGPMLEVLAGNEPMPARRVQGILLQLCTALSELHEHGLFHRDVTAHSVVMSRGHQRDHVQLLELGWLKSESIVRGFASPSPTDTHYMAPEQVLSESIDARADIYALGVLAYRLLTGTVPFSGPPAEVMFHHLRTPPVEPADVIPDLRQIVLKAMSKRREDRFHDIGQLAKALHSCQLDEPRASIPPTAQFLQSIDGSNIVLRFLSTAAFDRFRRHQLSSGQVFVPGDAPTGAGLLRLVMHVPGRPPLEAPVTLLGLVDRHSAERHGTPHGFALTLRGPLAPHDAPPTPEQVEAKSQGSRGRRMPERLPVIFGSSAADSYLGMTTNLSARGAGISSPYVMPAGEQIHLILTLPSRGTARCDGVVMWSRATEGKGALGVRLISADGGYRDFIRSRLARPPPDPSVEDTEPVPVDRN